MRNLLRIIPGGIIFILLYISSYSQGFVKITSGPVVNDGGWCYGACWADFNGDGNIDLFVVNNQTGSNNNFLYMNNGDGSFTKVTSGVIVNDGGSSYGCTCADYDNDGDIDVFVSNYGGNNYLYSNNGDGTFTKITSGAIVNDGGNSTGCAWGDYDNDGYVDLYVCNRNQNNFLYHNNGNGTFTKITGVPPVNDNSNSGGCAWGDYDNDGFIDLFVANAGPAVDFLYHNNGNGTFTKVTTGPIISDTAHSSGGSWGDYDNDGDLDLFVTAGVVGTGFDRLYRNNGGGSFTKITNDPIVNTPHWSGGSAWGDFDNDGDPDMFVGGYDGANFLFSNNGNGTFTKIDTGIIVTEGSYKMGAMWGDYDNDGDLDLFTARNNYFGGNNTLYMNLGNGNKWINIKCVGVVSNRAAIGAKVYCRALINGTSVRQLQVVTSQSGGAISGMNSLNAEFGLGNAVSIDSIRIEWPSGIIDRYSSIAPNRFLTAVEGQGLNPVAPVTHNVPGSFALYQNYPNPFNPNTKIKIQIAPPLRTNGAPLPLTGGDVPVVAGSVGVKLIIYDVLGREVSTLVNERLQPGTYEVDWDGSNYASGIYYYRLQSGNFVEIKKMVLLK